MPQVSDQQRHKLEAAIAASLTLLYLGAARSAAMDLGVPPPTDPPEDAQQGIADKAAKTALLVQQGINYQMDPPADSVYAGIPQADLLAGARGYNDNTLIPYLTSWGSHQGLVDTYQNTPQTTTDPMAEASSQAQAYLWEWSRLSGSDLADECGDAEGLGPAPFDDIMAITQGVPPLHRNCACDLSPAGRIPAESAAPANDTSGEPVAELPITPDITAAAQGAIDRAALAEPEVTADLQAISALHDGTMEGLDYRLKSVDSMARKVATDLDPAAGMDAVTTADSMKDALRYTMVHAPEGFTEALQSTIDDLVSRGYTVTEKDIKNTWLDGAVYKGINANLRTPDGYMFELQFHTPESLAVKMDQIHELYEEYRLPTTSLERQRELYDEMVGLSAVVTDPAGIQTIGTLKRAVRP